MNAGFEANVGTDPGPRKKSGLKMGKIHQTNACPKSGYLLSMSINHQNIIYIYLSYVKLMYFLLKSPGMPIGSQWKGNQSCDKY